MCAARDAASDRGRPRVEHPRALSWNLDFRVATLRSPVDRMNNRSDGTLNARPARRAEYNDGDTARRELLLIFQVRISRNEYLEAFLPGHVEQLAVF